VLALEVEWTATPMIDGLCATLLPRLLLLVRHALLLDTGLLALVADPDVTDRARLRSPRHWLNAVCCNRMMGESVIAVIVHDPCEDAT